MVIARVGTWDYVVPVVETWIGITCINQWRPYIDMPINAALEAVSGCLKSAIYALKYPRI